MISMILTQRTSPPKAETPNHRVYYKSKCNQSIEKQRRQRGGGGQNDSRQRRLEKNRESARESRKRKKGYISSLEQKVAGLESEVNRLRN